MALRKESFDEYHERARTMENNQQFIPQDHIAVGINRKLYHRIKAAASMKHVTVTQYVEQLLDEMVPEINDVVKPGHPPTQEALEKLREMSEEIFRRNNYQYLGNSVEEIREMREERLRQLMGEDDINE